MTVETANYISQLDPDLPLNADQEAEGAAQIRTVKTAVQQSFPNVSGPVTATHTDLSTVGVTQAVTDSSTKVASTANVDAKILAASLAATVPTQSGNAGKTLRTDGTSVSWSYSGYAARTSNTVLGLSNNDNFIEVTSGTFSQTLAAAATLGGGWRVFYKNSGTGTVTLDPNGGELINGASTYAMAPGEGRVIVCTGTAFRFADTDPVGTHRVAVTVGNGHGSTNTKIRRYTTTKTSTGTAITYADSAANGASFTINEPGLYEMSMTDIQGASAVNFGVSVNSAQLTTNIQSITDADRVFAASTPNGSYMTITRTWRLAAGDVVRPHTAGTADGATALESNFSIIKVGF